MIEKTVGDVEQRPGRGRVEQHPAVREQLHVIGEHEPALGNVRGTEAGQHRPQCIVHRKHVGRTSRR